MYRAVGAGLKPALAMGTQPPSSSPYPALHKAIAITPKPYGPMYRDVGAGFKPALPWNATAISSPYSALHKAIAITPKPYGPMCRDVGAGLKPAPALPRNEATISISLVCPDRTKAVPAYAGTTDGGRFHTMTTIPEPVPKGSPEGFSPLARGLGDVHPVTPLL